MLSLWFICGFDSYWMPSFAYYCMLLSPPLPCAARKRLYLWSNGKESSSRLSWLGKMSRSILAFRRRTLKDPPLNVFIKCLKWTTGFFVHVAILLTCAWCDLLWFYNYLTLFDPFCMEISVGISLVMSNRTLVSPTPFWFQWNLACC